MSNGLRKKSGRVKNHMVHYRPKQEKIMSVYLILECLELDEICYDKDNALFNKFLRHL